MKGNTVGSPNEVEKAYIAGFLDGDGSIMLQIKRRSDTSRGYRFMATVCFYQDSRHEKTLFWIRQRIGIGYISRRNDGMSELRINGFKQVGDFLSQIKAYSRFKTLQVEAMITACRILSRGINKLSRDELVSLVGLVLVIQGENYTSHHKKTEQEIIEMLGL
jgi:intein/homing endonuclease